MTGDDRFDAPLPQGGKREVGPRPIELRRIARDDVERDAIPDMGDPEAGDQVEIFLEPPPVVREEKLVAADPTSNDRRGAFDARGDEEVHDGMALIRRQVTMALTNNASEAHGRLPLTIGRRTCPDRGGAEVRESVG